MSRRALRCMVLLLALCTAPAWAHTRSETHSAWLVSGAQVHLTFTVPELEAKRITPDGTLPSNAQLAAYIDKNVGASADGKPCPESGMPRSVTGAPGYQRFEFAFQCPETKNIRLHSSAFFELVATHTTFAQIESADGSFTEQLITKDHQELDVSGAASENRLQNAGFSEYILMGIMHIFTGVDHMSFLVGLVLISRRLRDLAFVITGFTVGHSVTLALAVTGILRPHAEFIDALVALTIALVGAENIAVASRRPAMVAAGLGGLLVLMAVGKLAGIGGLPTLLLLGAGIFAANYLMISGHLRDAARVRLVVTVVFGLIHGFGFASDLLQMRLPATRLAELLLGFNLGVEIGQLSLVAALIAVVALLRRMHWTLPRPIVVDVASSFLVGLGLFWFIGRSYAG